MKMVLQWHLQDKGVSNINKNYFLSLIIIISLVFVFLIVGTIRNNNSLVKINNILTNDFDKTQRDSDKLINAVTLLSQDMNVIQSVLDLPDKEYSFFENESNNSSDDFVFYKALDYISHKNNIDNNLPKLDLFIKSKEFKDFLNKNELKINKIENENFVITRSNKNYFFMNYSKKENNYEFNSINEISKIFENNLESDLSFFKKNIVSINNHYSKYSELLSSIDVSLTKSNIKDLLFKNKISFSNISNNDGTKFTFFDRNKVSQFFINININNLILTVDNKSINDLNELEKNIIQRLNEIDSRDETELKIDLSINKLKDIISDKAFLKILKNKNLSISKNIREDNDYFYFDILNNQKEKYGSFAVQKFFGEIYLIDKDDVPISSLITFKNKINPKKKIDIPEKLPTFNFDKFNKDSLNFLICGSHERNTDTIIVLSINTVSREIFLISVPRDLYIDERRMNDFYKRGGPLPMVKSLSRITGLNIKKYIVIDMFAFIDAVNILGGVDVELENDLIDPTYKIKDNGKWATLYYKKGTYKLNGIEALRIARSRHYSDDFDRSKRQQQLIMSIKDKLNTLKISDFPKLYNLVSTLIKYVDTNISAIELMNLVKKYGDFNIKSFNNLSTDNILYQTYSKYGEWILLPENDDWNVLKWYINDLIK